MTRPIQKLEEQRWVEMMRRGFGGLPMGRVEPSEEPDVRVVGPERCVGIEVTELHQSDKADGLRRRAQEEEHKLIAARARELSETGGTPALWVTVHFNHHFAVSRASREAIAQGLASIVENNIPDVNTTKRVEVWRTLPNPVPAISSVSIFQPSPGSRGHWSVPVAGWFQAVFVDELQEAIDSKSSKIERYLKQCDECWLLVVASGLQPSGLFEPDATTLGHIYRSPFSRTLFLEGFGGAVTELRTDVGAMT